MTRQSTQAQILPISTGSRTEERTCEEHGTYQADFFLIGGRKIFSPCPSCMVEAQERGRAEEEAQQQSAVRANLQNSGIPKRFMAASLSEYKPQCKEAFTALAVIKKYITSFQERLQSGGGLVLCGMPGTGKTHLACAIGANLISAGHTAKYTTSFKAMSSVKETFGQAGSRDVIADFISPDLLIVDEVGVQYGSETEKIIFYQIINGRYEEVKPTVLISNLTETELSAFIGDRCFDRMREGGGVVIPFTWKSYRK